ncbi:hypothetical protein [Serinibacter arcticus]|uniref:hypothetical protein n=1 Tax=Serinibacter arcticus TaxID=1655435 RepID=UPI001091E3D2|nr:hypothetical protein [Serinibacter arcticus]
MSDGVSTQPELELGLAMLETESELVWPDGPLPRAGLLPEAGLDGFESGLFVQAHARETLDAAKLVEQYRLGVVFTLDRNSCTTMLQQARSAIEPVRRRHRSSSIMIDANHYSGKNRKRVADGISRQWAVHQLETLGLPWALTDSGFVESLGDVDALLNMTRSLPERTIIALPMPSSLLRDEATAITDLVNDFERPVALLLEHPSDPFDDEGVAESLVQVIRNSNPAVSLLRSDTSAIGALCHGAAAGAVGAHSGLRHIYPRSTGGAGEKLSLVVPRLLGYYSQHRFEQAYFRDPLAPLWRCSCWFCNDRDLTWIGNEPGDQGFRASFQHSTAALAEIGHLVSGSTTTSSQAKTWSALCELARTRHLDLANPSGSPWKPKAALQYWARLAPVRAGVR